MSHTKRGFGVINVLDCTHNCDHFSTECVVCARWNKTRLSRLPKQLYKCEVVMLQIVDCHSPIFRALIVTNCNV